MSAARSPGDVVRMYWERQRARDWDGAQALLHEDVVLDWPVSRERLRGAQAVTRVNREYPPGWDLEVLRVVTCGAEVVSEVEVRMDGQQHRSVAFWDVRRGLIVAGVEYWTVVGADEAPASRAGVSERY